MNQSFYTAAVGAHQQMKRMNVQGNNIANVNTYGFKAEKASFSTLMHGMVNGVDGEDLPKGSGSRLVTAPTDFSGNYLVKTGRTHDYAINGEGFFALYEPATGDITYTRDGSFGPAMYLQPDEKGEMEEVYYLCDGEGRQVLDTQGYPILIEDPAAVQPVGIFTLQYRDGLEHAGSGMFAAQDRNGAVWMGDAKVVQGYLEGSNVDLATELAKVIESQRSYSYALKMLQTSDEIETTINNLRT